MIGRERKNVHFVTTTRKEIRKILVTCFEFDYHINMIFQVTDFISVLSVCVYVGESFTILFDYKFQSNQNMNEENFVVKYVLIRCEMIFILQLYGHTRFTTY